MPWLTYALYATSVTPVGTATGDIVTYILGFGPLGVAVVLFALGYIVPKPVKDSAVEAARADVVAENERLREALAKAEDQRDEALRFTQEQVTPLLSDFVHATGALLPILQGLVTRLEITGREDSRESRRERR